MQDIAIQHKTKVFNTTAICIPSKHYMVDIEERLKKIKVLIDTGQYFTINKARQYGKNHNINGIREVSAKRVLYSFYLFSNIQ